MEIYGTEVIKVFVVVRKTVNILGEPIKEFRRLFLSLKASKDYINCGKKAGIESAQEEFVEFHLNC